MKWKILPHTADYAFRVYGRDVQELCLNSFQALKESMFNKFSVSNQVSQVKLIKIEAAEPALLIIDLLREIHYLIVADKIFPIDLKIENLNNSSMSAKLKYRQLKPEDRVINEVKAITYHAVEIIRKDKVLMIEIVCDV
jgi:SHS2 domain-containing protein